MKIRAISVWMAALTMVSLGSSALAKEQVPIKGEFATEFSFTSPPPVASLTLSGSGQVSHLGKATCFSGNEVVDFTDFVPPLWSLPPLTGTLELTAANGDKLVGEMDALAIPAEDGSITFFGILTFTGGTGRFAHATGTAEFGGTGTPTSAFGGIGWFEFEGTVTSPGASKK
jgi:hypothetical protein